MMNYLDIKALNDALARFPALAAEMEMLEREIACACGDRERPADLEVAAVQFRRARLLLESSRDRMVDRYVSGFRTSEAGSRQGGVDRRAACFCGLDSKEGPGHVQAA